MITLEGMEAKLLRNDQDAKPERSPPFVVEDLSSPEAKEEQHQAQLLFLWVQQERARGEAPN